MSKKQKANGTVPASFPKDGYRLDPTALVFTPGNPPSPPFGERLRIQRQEAVS